MENLNTLSTTLTTFLDNLQNISNLTQPDLQQRLKSLIESSTISIFSSLPQIKTEIESKKKIIEDLVNERDLLLASKVMMTDRNDSMDNDNKNRPPNFNEFFFKEIDGVRVQLKNIIENFKDNSKIKPDKIIQINALCLFLLEYIKRNGLALREKFKEFESFNKIENEENKEFGGLMAEVKKYMEGDSKRLNSMLNTFEFKKNFSLYEQNIKLKKLNFKYSQKIKKMSKRVNFLVQKFSELIEKKQYESIPSFKEDNKRSQTSNKKSKTRGFHLDFSKM